MIKKILEEKNLARIIWLAFLIGMGSLYLFHVMRLMHPFPLPAILFFTILLPASFILVFKGFFTFLIFPKRLKTAGWILMGTTPIWIIFFLKFYMSWTIQNGLFTYNIYNLEINKSSSLENLKRYYLYPIRFEGEKVTMWTDWKEWDKGAWQNVHKMDEFIKKIEKTLNKECSAKIDWVRPERLTSSGMNLQGMMFGSVPNRFIENEDFQLERLDREGIATVLLDHLSGNLDSPSELLKFGWKQLQASEDPGELSEQLWRDRLLTVPFSIEEILLNKNLNVRYPYAIYGGPFVEYLLETYSAEQFLDLYTHGRTESFPADIKRIYGIPLEKLESNFWSHLEKRSSSLEHLTNFNALYGVKLDKGVDKKEWMNLCEGHQKGYLNFLKAYEHSRYLIEEYEEPVKKTENKETVPIEFETVIDDLRDGLRRRIHWKETNEIISSTKDYFFNISSEKGISNWKLKTNSTFKITGTGKPAIHQFKKECKDNSTLLEIDLSQFLYMMNEGFQEFFQNETLTIIKLENFEKENRIFWKLTGELTDSEITGVEEQYVINVTLDPQHNWTITDLLLRYKNIERTQFSREYETQFKDDQRLLPESLQVKELDNDETIYMVRKFRQFPMKDIEREFQPETYGITLPPSKKPVQYSWEFLVSFWGMIFSFPTGLLFLFLQARKLKKQGSSPPSEEDIPASHQLTWPQKKKLIWSAVILLFFIFAHYQFVIQIRKNTWASNEKRLPEDLLTWEHRYPNIFQNNLAKINNEILEEIIYFLKGKKYTRLNHVARHPYTDYDFYKFPASEDIDYIDLYNSDLTEYGLERLSKFPGVQFITFEGKNISDTVFNHMAGMKNLESLTSFNTRITDKGLEQTNDFPKLDYLQIKSSLITEKGIGFVANNPELTNVILQGMNFTKNSLHHLTRLPKLTTLALKSSTIDDEIFLELKGHPTIKELFIYDASITDASLPVILSMKNLNRLILDETQITKDGFYSLKKKIQRIEWIKSKNSSFD